jgi:hypothetical protein
MKVFLLVPWMHFCMPGVTVPSRGGYARSLVGCAAGNGDGIVFKLKGRMPDIEA